MVKLYVFLGNYGKAYIDNRHNVTWQFLASLKIRKSLAWERKFKGRTAVYETGGGPVWFLMPETYMNNSGESVAELARFYKLSPEEVMAVHDDLEMAFGCFGFKFAGGLGGHNGLRSIEQHLGTRDFARLRFGIGRPAHKDVAGYVLSDFGLVEREILATLVFPSAEKALMECLDKGFDAVKDKYKKVACF